MFTPPLLNCCLIVLRVRVGVLSAQKGDKSGPSIRSAACSTATLPGRAGRCCYATAGRFTGGDPTDNMSAAVTCSRNRLALTCH